MPENDNDHDLSKRFWKWLSDGRALAHAALFAVRCRLTGHEDQTISTGFFGYKECVRCHRRVELY
jgi:hypothetical protein